MIQYQGIGDYFGSDKDPVPYSFKFIEAGQNFYFVPQSVLERGVTYQKDDTSRVAFFPSMLKNEVQQSLTTEGQLLAPNAIAGVTKGEEFVGDLAKFNLAGPGYVIPESIYKTSFTPTKAREQVLNKPWSADGVYVTGISGIGQKDGENAFIFNAAGRDQAQAWLKDSSSGDFNLEGVYVIPGKKWYETGLGKAGLLVGGALIGGGLLGLGATGGTAAGSAAAGGTATGGIAAAGGAGIVGTPGVSTIFPVAAPVAPTVSTIAPIATTGGVALGAFTPAPNSLQAALPGMGVETAASAGGFTAAPGSFQAALPGLGIASAPSLSGNLAASGISATDALLLANQAIGLLGAGQNPIVPQQQGLPSGGRQGQGVDYSGLLALLQRQARTPGVSSLLTPAQVSPIYTTLLPNASSLLG